MPPDSSVPDVGETVAAGDQMYVPQDAVSSTETSAPVAEPDIIWALSPPAAKTPRQILREQTDGLHHLDLNLRRFTGYFALIELVLANALFFYYAWWRPEREGVDGLTPAVLVAWYGAVVIQVVGMLFVATRWATPKRGGR